MPVKPYVLYLHGFLSSPQSLKAQQTLAYCLELGLGERIAIPQLSDGPARTIAQLKALVEELSPENLVLMGSSLGGYYATYLSEFYKLRRCSLILQCGPTSYGSLTWVKSTITTQARCML